MGMQSLKRIGTPPTWLRSSRSWVSDEARWITGDIVAVDGGSKL